MIKCSKCGSATNSPFHIVNGKMVCNLCYENIPLSEKENLVEEFQERIGESEKGAEDD